MSGRPMAGFLDALAFLTVVPVPGARGVAARGGTWAFPVVGLVVGGLLFAALSVPWPTPARAALALALWVLVTGGLHEDAWADVADGAFAPVPPARRREILKDPRIGAHGATALALLLLLRWGALVSVAPSAALAAPVVGRWAMVVAPRPFPPARPTGLGGAFAAAARPGTATVSAALVLAVISTAAGYAIVARAWVAGAAAGWLYGRFLRSRFGGLTGDGYGAVGVAAELAALWAFLPWEIRGGC